MNGMVMRQTPPEFRAMLDKTECYCNHLFFVNMGNGQSSARCLMKDFAIIVRLYASIIAPG